jgi:hypothetical protein
LVLDENSWGNQLTILPSAHHQEVMGYQKELKDRLTEHNVFVFEASFIPILSETNPHAGITKRIACCTFLQKNLSTKEY